MDGLADRGVHLAVVGAVAWLVSKYEGRGCWYLPAHHLERSAEIRHGGDVVDVRL